jgi:hypothetical protein
MCEQQKSKINQTRNITFKSRYAPSKSLSMASVDPKLAKKTPTL